MFDRFDDPEAVQWAKDVKSRDNHICRICGKYGVRLHSHHMNSWDLFVDQRYYLANGICLCEQCHLLFHKIYGKGKNTQYQFKQFLKTIHLFKRFLAEL